MISKALSLFYLEIAIHWYLDISFIIYYDTIANIKKKTLAMSRALFERVEIKLFEAVLNGSDENLLIRLILLLFR
jgi:hypothetical protein